jgi:hypothetical protein
MPKQQKFDIEEDGDPIETLMGTLFGSDDAPSPALAALQAQAATPPPAPSPAPTPTPAPAPPMPAMPAMPFPAATMAAPPTAHEHHHGLGHLLHKTYQYGSWPASAALAYHGYARDQSWLWALAWGVFGGAIWPLALPIALAQGFAKRK